MSTYPARRVFVPESGDINEAFPLEPGDYVGPCRGYTGETEAVWFVVPVAADESVDPRLRGIRHVTSPPHRFRECADGSLEIRESIGCLPRVGGGYIWHGYLDEGNVWRQV